MDPKLKDHWKNHIEYELGKLGEQRGRFLAGGLLLRDPSSYTTDRKSSRVKYGDVKGMTAVAWKAELALPEKGNGSLYSVVFKDQRRASEQLSLRYLSSRDHGKFLHRLSEIYEDDFEITHQIPRPADFLAEGVVSPRSIFGGNEYVRLQYILVDETNLTVLIDLDRSARAGVKIDSLIQEAARLTKVLHEYSTDAHRKQRPFGLRMEHGSVAFSVDPPGLKINRNASYFVTGTAAALLDFMFFD